MPDVCGYSWQSLINWLFALAIAGACICCYQGEPAACVLHLSACLLVCLPRNSVVSDQLDMLCDMIFYCSVFLFLPDIKANLLDNCIGQADSQTRDRTEHYVCVLLTLIYAHALPQTTYYQSSSRHFPFGDVNMTTSIYTILIRTTLQPGARFRRGGIPSPIMVH